MVALTVALALMYMLSQADVALNERTAPVNRSLRSADESPVRLYHLLHATATGAHSNISGMIANRWEQVVVENIDEFGAVNLRGKCPMVIRRG